MLTAQMNRFVHKFREKSKSELEYILSNTKDYQSEAVEAARYLLDNNVFRKETVLPGKPKLKIESDSEVFSFFRPLRTNAKKYTDTYRLNDLMSILTVAFLYSAAYSLLEYYSGERWLREIDRTVFLIIAILSFLANHIIYKIEHKLSNHYLGRVFHTAQYALFIVIIRIVHDSFLTKGFEPDESIYFYFGVMLFICISIFIIEALMIIPIYLLKKLFNWSPI